MTIVVASRPARAAYQGPRKVYTGPAIVVARSPHAIDVQERRIAGSEPIPSHFLAGWWEGVSGYVCTRWDRSDHIAGYRRGQNWRDCHGAESGPNGWRPNETHAADALAEFMGENE